MLGAIVSGLLLALAFPKFNLFWLAWVGLVPLFFSLGQAPNLKQALKTGFVFSLVFFAVHLNWLFSLYRFVGWFTLLAWASLILWQSLFILLFIFLFQQICFCVRRWTLVYITLAALAWAVVEWLRSLGPFGTPLGDLAYSQVQLLPWLQIVRIMPVYGLSFMMVFFNLALLAFWQNRQKWLAVVISLALILVPFVYGWLEINNLKQVKPLPVSKNLRLALIQPNVDQERKLNITQVKAVFDLQRQMTRQAALAKPGIIIWPESSVFAYMLSDPYYSVELAKLAQEVKTWLVIGTPYYGGPGKVYNSIISLSPSGEVVSRYDKERLVAFGEYLPWRPWLFSLLEKAGYFQTDYVSNPVPTPLLVLDQKIAAAICFESTFPETIKKRVSNDSAFILTLTNDAWFGDSSAPYFHLNTDIFRAIENRKYFVQVGNTGISALITPWGEVVKQSQLNRQEILIIDLPL